MKTPTTKKKYFSTKTAAAKFILLLLCIGMTTITILQDLLQSTLNHSAFYLSESALFKIPWLLYFPLSLALLSIKKQAHKIGINIITVFSISFIHIAISSFLIAIIAQYFLNTPFTFSDLFKNKIGEKFYIVLLIYSGIVFFLKKRKLYLDEIPTLAASIHQKNISIKQARKTIVLPIQQIEWITSNTPYVTIHVNGKKYHHTATLKKMLVDLGGENFVRIHRSCIVNVSKIDSLVSRLNGDYDVKMQSSEVLRLSRTYSKNLKGKLL